MEKSRLEMKVGLFVFVTLLVLAILLVQFSKSTSLFRSTYTLKLHTGNVSGLKERAGVLLAGVNVGTIQKIEIEPGGTNVMVKLQIYSQYPVYHDARFVIEANGFLGDQYVAVIPTENTEPLLTNGQDVECEAPFNLQEVARGAAGLVTRLDDTAKKLDSSVTDLRVQLLNAKTLANIGGAVTNVRVLTEQALGTINNINRLISTNGTQVDIVMSNFVLFSTQLTQLGNSASDILATNGASLTAATKNLQDMINDAKAGQGLAGALLENQQVSTNVQLLAANLAITSSNLNRYGLWHILWSHPATDGNAGNSESHSKHP